MTSTGTISSFETIIGIDISKDHLDAFELPGRARHRFAQSGTGIRSLMKRVGLATSPLVVFEATGPYHRDLEQALGRAGIVFSRVNPARAKAFSKVLGQPAKTDSLDAAMLAALGQSGLAAPTPPLPESLHELKALETALSALIADRARLRTRAHTLVLALLKRQNTAQVALLDKQIKALEAEIRRRLDEDPDLRRKTEILTSIPGIGLRTAHRLICRMPELGTLSQGQAASLSGTAPRTRQSGKWHGHAFVQGGRALVRQALYMPALIAARFNPDMKQLYQRMTQSGKPRKVALATIMRKLVCLANTLIKNNRIWTTNPA